MALPATAPPSRPPPRAPAGSQGEEASTRALSTGEAVRAFYHMNDHPNRYRYVRVQNSAPEGTPEAVATVGLSTGWIPATVAEDWKPGGASGGDDRVLVKLHGHFEDVYKMDPEPVKGMYWRVKRSLVRPTGGGQTKLELSLLVVRWWDYWNRNSRRSRSHNVCNEEMILDIIDGPSSPHEAYGEQGAYEVHTAFVRSSEDLEAISSSIAQAMRGQHKAALYFLWPTQRPAVEKRQPGCVAEPALLGLMRRMEALGVESCWPHPSRLYRELSGKTWVPRVCQSRPDLRVPPTVMVDVERWQSDPEGTVKDIIVDLKSLGGQAQREVTDEQYKGVVKLGFSWMGEDVLPFTGPTQLWKALSQLLDGAQPGAVCLAQQRVEGVTCELRTVNCRDLAGGPEAVKTELVRMKMRPPRHQDETFCLTGHLTMTETEARDAAFKGDAGALQAAEAEVQRLSRLWFAWFREEGYGTPTSVRIDFMVVAPRAGSGNQPEVWTVELCECGGALCGLDHQARTTAVLNACRAGGEDGSAADPDSYRQLPSMIPPTPPPAQAWRRQDAPAGQGAAAGGSTLARRFSGGKIGAIVALIALLLFRLWTSRRGR